jgi:hypothetical protein
VRLADLEEKLAKYMPIYEDKRRNFRGVRHENSLSELQYTQFMVYKNMVDSLKKEISEIKMQLKHEAISNRSAQGKS